MKGLSRFISSNWRWLVFAFLGPLFGSGGQTFFVSFFVPTFQEAFEINAGTYGTLYSAATILAAFALGTVGRLIDRMATWRFAAGVALGLSAACALVSVSLNIWMLFVAMFAIRLFGQGLSTHVAMTTIAKKFDRARGTALSLALLGFGAGEILYPQIAPWMLALGWRTGWMGLAAAALCVLLPAWVLLAWGEPPVVETDLRETKGVRRTADHHQTLQEALRDPKFYLLIPNVFLPGLILTALFLFQLRLAESKGWSEAWLAQCFVGFAAARVGGGLLIGPVVDRIGAIRLFPFVLVPMMLGLLLLNDVPSPHAAWMYLSLCGLSVGIGSGVRGAFWAEAYGVLHLGAIRSFLSAGSVIATGVGAMAMGQLLDLGVTITALANGAAVIVVVSTCLAWLSCRTYK